MNLEGKKVLVVCTTDNMIWQFLTPHIDRLAQLGASVECACNETGFWYADLAARGYAMHKLGFERSPFKRANLTAYRGLKKLIKDGAFDIVYCHQPVGGMLGRLAGKKYNCKVVYVAHGFFFWRGCPIKNKLLYKTAERLLSKKTDALITMNEEDFDAAKKMKAKAAYKVHGAGSKGPREKDTDIRKEFGIAADAKVVLTVSELIPRKNYPLMLRAMAKTDAVYVICGCGREEDNIKALAGELGITDHVIFAGYRRDVYNFMLAADVMLHFAKHEGLPVAVIEAMSCGLPVVASDIRGNRDLLSGGSGALLPLLSSPETVAYALTVLLNDELRRRGMGEAGKAEAEKYRIGNVLPEYDKIFEEL